MSITEQPGAIALQENGPLIVNALRRLRTADGEEIAVTQKIALCRCGGSATKPFCDGTHKKNGFSGAREAPAAAATRDAYRGIKITIYDNRAICAHSARCSDNLAAVFKYGAEPWIDPDGAGIDAIIETVRKCPSGALSYAIDGIEAQPAERSPGITVTKDGPYAVVGNVALTGQAADDLSASECYTLCRCGGSKNKPFCDGTHWSIGFKDDSN